MKTPIVVLTLALEIAFIIYCIHMTYLLDAGDPAARELITPNFFIGAVILGFGYFVVISLSRDISAQSRRS